MALSVDNAFNRVQDRLKISEPKTRFATLRDAAGGLERQREYRLAPPAALRRRLWPRGFASENGAPATTGSEH